MPIMGHNIDQKPSTKYTKPFPLSYSPNMYVRAAVNTTHKMMKTMAVHFHEHLLASPFRN